MRSRVLPVLSIVALSAAFGVAVAWAAIGRNIPQPLAVTQVGSADQFSRSDMSVWLNKVSWGATNTYVTDGTDNVVFPYGSQIVIGSCTAAVTACWVQAIEADLGTGDGFGALVDASPQYGTLAAGFGACKRIPADIAGLDFPLFAAFTNTVMTYRAKTCVGGTILNSPCADDADCVGGGACTKAGTKGAFLVFDGGGGTGDCYVHSGR